ncbi:MULTISPECIES: hypothetical protein [unclassified Streptomyces]|uniref:hypothetical protein n=1 Tax=unclassified Streptomyces TaxID=2593676 RepID=UPI002E115623|nr:hypothetical protein OG452_03235 [Streptomyces sp. NBC_01197]WSS52820.1 hypothetical protein OG708_31830 [Streptomyces sp. NBC_01180]
MRLRSMLVASAFAASAVLGGAASASALDYGHEHHHHHGIAGAGAFHEEKSGVFYHNIGGPAGITHAGAFKDEREGWFAFMAH